MIKNILQWRQDSRHLNEIIEARKISRQAALNCLRNVLVERATGKPTSGPGRRS